MTVREVYSEFAVKFLVGGDEFPAISEMRKEKQKYFGRPVPSGVKTAVLRRRHISKAVERTSTDSFGDVTPAHIEKAISEIEDLIQSKEWSLNEYYMHINGYQRSDNKNKRKLPPHDESNEPRRARARLEDEDARRDDDCIENTSE